MGRKVPVKNRRQSGPGRDYGFNSTPAATAIQAVHAYKPSRFNLLFKNQGSHYIFNTWTLGLATVDRQTYNLLKTGQDDPGSLIKLAIRKPLEFNELLSGHNIVDAELSEERQVWLRYSKIRFSTNVLNATIIPTNDCNLACKYCYQKRNSIHMDDTVQQKVCSFLLGRCADKKILGVTWYGGEPLLATDIIQRISSELIAGCKEKNIDYKANIVTNGTLLTYEKVKMLKSINVRQVQITIDGIGKTHDIRRPFKSGRGSSFEAILKNIDAILGEIEINIRINVDKTNLKGAFRLLKFMQSRGYLHEGNKFHVGLGYVRPWTENICNIYASCLKPGDFAQAILDFMVQKCGGEAASRLFPEREALCTAVYEDSYVIDPLGNLKKCWIDVCPDGETKGKVGDCSQSYDFYNSNTLRWLSYDPINNAKQCGRCVYFPICLGGCPYLQLFGKNMSGDACAFWHTHLIRLLKAFVQNCPAGHPVL